jgi:GT2 family glycosyltransferase
MLSVVVPTISGREESLARTISSYEKTLEGVPHEIIVVKDESSWPLACNVGYGRSSGDVIHWTADDLEALPGWYEDVPALLERDELPAPAVFDYRPDGKFANAEDGPDGAVTWFTRVPVCRRDQAERIGLWPEITYYADVWFSEKARSIGIETRMLYSYAFVHHWSPIGRVDSKHNLEQAWRDFEGLRTQMREEAQHA